MGRAACLQPSKQESVQIGIVQANVKDHDEPQDAQRPISGFNPDPS